MRRPDVSPASPDPRTRPRRGQREVLAVPREVLRQEGLAAVCLLAVVARDFKVVREVDDLERRVVEGRKGDGRDALLV